MMVTEEQYYKDHAALLGHVTLAWNDCHYSVLSIFRTLTGVSWETAYAIFFALQTDRARQRVTLALMKEVLNADGDQPMKELGAQLISQLGQLAGERNLATHMMWITMMPDRELFPEAQPEIQPHPFLPRPQNLKGDFKAQFSDLTAKLRNLFGELVKYDLALGLHLVQSRASRGTVKSAQ
jgi:hypothetical protein